MRRTVLFIAAALVLASSCNKIEENAPSGKDSGRTVITAVAGQIGAETKVEMAYCYEARWQAGDQIHVTQGKTTDTFTLVGGEGTTKGTFEGTKSITGEIEAFYPVSVGKTMTWPEVQTVEQAMPMYAHQDITGAEGETVSFSSLGAILQIVFNSTVDDITLGKIELKDGGKDISGPFSLDEDGKAVIASNTGAGVTLDLGAGKALGKGANFFYLAIPAGKYDDLTISFYTTDRRVCTMHSTTMPEVMHNTVCRITLTGTKFEKNPVLPGVFTVDDKGTKVRFSQGNMFWDGNSFEFEDNQYDYPSTWNASHVGHFYWSRSAEVAKAVNYSDPGRLNNDVLFTNAGESSAKPDFTVGGISGKFRTLSMNEWKYILKDRSDRYMESTVCGVRGRVIAPDDFSGTLSGSYDSEQWRIAESQGVVFLPAVGSGSGSTLYNTGDKGYYWSSAPWTDESAQMTVFFIGYQLFSFQDTYRDYTTCAIRLVEDVTYVNRISLDKTELELFARQNAQLTATVYPGYAPDKSVVWSSSNTEVATVSEGLVSAVSAGTATITATSVDGGVTANCTVTVDPVLPGVFTVDDKGTKVRFSQGNMFWDGNSFEFEKSQFDFPETLDASHIGHFYWSKDKKIARGTSYSDPGRANDDVLFTNSTETAPARDFTVGGVTGEFRSLSQLEWQYLAQKNPDLVTVNGIKCFAIAPDSYSGTIKSTYDDSTVKAAEAEGVVFLPAAGSRYSTLTYFNEGDGYYWTSAPWGTDAQALIFFSLVKTYDSVGRDFAYAIRLVKNVD